MTKWLYFPSLYFILFTFNKVYAKKFLSQVSDEHSEVVTQHL